MNLPIDLIGPKPDLFLDRLSGGIVWLSGRRHGYSRELEQPLGSYIAASILIWDRTTHKSQLLITFNLN